MFPTFFHNYCHHYLSLQHSGVARFLGALVRYFGGGPLKTHSIQNCFAKNAVAHKLKLRELIKLCECHVCSSLHRRIVKIKRSFSRFFGQNVRHRLNAKLRYCNHAGCSHRCASCVLRTETSVIFPVFIARS